jgi:hypothetical protein
MGHCGEFDYVLRVTAANLVLPLQGLKPYSKNCEDFRAMGKSIEFGYVLWAIAQDLFMHYDP